jgi:DNA-binding beta-propeller fold protein YncE
MKGKILWVPALVLMLTLLSASVSLLVRANASEQANGYRRIATITGPGIAPRGTKWAFDISWVDEASQRYYLADASNASVDIFDARTSTFLERIRGFTGYHGSIETQGPAGLVTDTLYQLWVGDGNSTVKVIDLFTHTIVATLSTGGTKRADELVYDPQEQLLLVTNGSDQPPFATFISVLDRQVVGKIVFPQALDGLEAPLWDAVTHKFYVSVPTTRQAPGGEVAVIDPMSRQVVGSYSLPNCHPNGLALGPNQDLLLGCDGHPLIIDAMTGRVVATIMQVNGCDEVWYNAGDHRYYLAAFTNASGPVLSIVDADTHGWIANLPTVPKAHSVAADAQNNHIFVPLSGQGIAVYAQT